MKPDAGIRLISWVGWFLLASPLLEAQPGVVPLRRAHAHNDYLHDRPLRDALDRGFMSVEADIYLVGDQLLVAHDRDKTRTNRTLEALYLDPLRDQVAANGGSVYRGETNFILLIDIKSEAEPTYAALRRVLERYRGILTLFESNRTQTGAVTIILSGNRPLDTVAREAKRWVGVDGRLPDLESNPSPHLMPLVSDNWQNHFAWRGVGSLSDEEQTKLGAFVRVAHEQGRRLRFWAAPDGKEGWEVLRQAGVDLINTDRLDELRAFLLQTSD